MDMSLINEYSIVKMDKVSRVYLNDGLLVIFEEGFQIRHGQMIGSGKQYDLSRKNYIVVSEIPIENVKRIITFDKVFQPFPFILALPSLLIGFITLLDKMNE